MEMIICKVYILVVSENCIQAIILVIATSALLYLAARSYTYEHSL